MLSNGDTLHGKFVSEIAGKVTFHSDPLGDVSLGWDKIKELHTSQKFAVLDDTGESRRQESRPADSRGNPRSGRPDPHASA